MNSVSSTGQWWIKSDQLYVTNVEGQSVSVIDLSSTMVATVAVGLSPLEVAADPQRPRDVKVPDDGAYIYVASSASGVINIFSPQQIAAASPLA